MDEVYRHPRLAGIYDALDPDRSDAPERPGLEFVFLARRDDRTALGTVGFRP